MGAAIQHLEDHTYPLPRFNVLSPFPKKTSCYDNGKSVHCVVISLEKASIGVSEIRSLNLRLMVAHLHKV